MRKADMEFYNTIKDFNFYTTTVQLIAEDALALLLDSVPDYRQHFPDAGEVKVSFFAGNVTFSNKVTCVVMHPNDFNKDHATLFRFGKPEENVSFDLYNAILACH